MFCWISSLLVVLQTLLLIMGDGENYDKVEEQTYSYYSSGRLQEAKNEHALVSFRYDNMGLPLEERCNEHKILRTYDRLGQIATLTSSLGANLA